MAIEGEIGGEGKLFVGEDKILRLTVQDVDSVPVDIGGWAIKLIVRKHDKDLDPAIFDKNASIVGFYNVDPLVNTQKAEVQLTDTEMNTVKAKTHRYSWKRMDDGSETILRFGDFIVQLATAR